MYAGDAHVLELGDRNGDENKGDNKAQTVTVGVEELLKLGKNKSEQCADDERREDLNERLNYDRNNAGVAAADGLSHTEHYCENYQTYCVVQSNDGKKEVGEWTLCLVLTNYHQGRRGSGCGCDSRKDQHCGEGKDILARGFNKYVVQSEKHAATNDGGDYRLQNTDDGCLLTGLLKLGKLEFASDRKGYKAERDVADDSEGVNVLKVWVSEAEVKSAGKSDSAKAEATDENTCDEIAGDCRELQKLAYTRHKQSRKCTDRNAEQYLNSSVHKCQISVFINFEFFRKKAPRRRDFTYI